MDFDDLLKKIANDGQFRTDLVDDPATALKSVGVHASDEMLTALKGVDYKSIQRVAEVFNKGEVRADTFFC